MRIGIIGKGAIASHVAQALARTEGITLAAWLLRAPASPGPLPGGAPVPLPGSAPGVAPAVVTRVGDLPPLDLLVDCAGHPGLAAHGPPALVAGIDVLTLSLGALADAVLADRLEAAAGTGGSVLHLCSGAIGGLDALRAARIGGLASVRYTGTKPPAGWRGSAAEGVLDLDALDALDGPAVHFTGTARAAALAYPKNANVAAAVALAGAGFDATEVVLRADPAAPGNIHRIEAEGGFGRFAFEVTGAGLPDNPRSSALAAMSALAAIAQMRAPVRFA